MNVEYKTLAERLNRECDCAVIDLGALRQRLDDVPARGPAAPLEQTHPHLFAEAPYFLDSAHALEMQRVVAAVHAVAKLPGYQQAVLANSPDIARHAQGPGGVFLGFDFHISADGPRLIEINTNAGGAFLNIAARKAERPCCPGMSREAAQPAAILEDAVHAMFMTEWRRARGDVPLRTIAIVDTNPRGQYLYPEFLLARQLLEARGIVTFIADPCELELSDGGIAIGGVPIDLIYNRLTDFYFESDANEILRTAYLRNLAVVTPHPHAHAIYSNKENLVLLSDAPALASLGVEASHIEVLTRAVPATRPVSGCEQTWWRDRGDWFFKPRHGFGSRGAYRGDKITRRVFAEIMNGDYIAQRHIAPSERSRGSGPERETFKVDIRCYVYDGAIQLMAARMYQGQTTNFRSAGGGFAPVHVIGDDLRLSA